MIVGFAKSRFDLDVSNSIICLLQEKKGRKKEGEVGDRLKRLIKNIDGKKVFWRTQTLRDKQPFITNFVNAFIFMQENRLVEPAGLIWKGILKFFSHLQNQTCWTDVLTFMKNIMSWEQLEQKKIQTGEF